MWSKASALLAKATDKKSSDSLAAGAHHPAGTATADGESIHDDGKCQCVKFPVVFLFIFPISPTQISICLRRICRLLAFKFNVDTFEPNNFILPLISSASFVYQAVVVSIFMVWPSTSRPE